MGQKVKFILPIIILFLSSCVSVKYLNPQLKEVEIERPKRPNIPIEKRTDEVIEVMQYALKLESICDDWEKIYNDAKIELNKNK